MNVIQCRSVTLPQLANWVDAGANENDPDDAIVVATHTGSDTTLHRLRLRIDGELEDVWIKRYRRQTEHARKEWSFLSRRAPCASIDFAEPLAFIESGPCIVTRHVPGDLLSSRLDDPSHDSIDACTRIGTWLASLHRDHIADESHPREAIAAGVLERAKRVCDKDSLQFVRSAIETNLVAATDIDLLRVRTHGDFGPFNIIINEHRGAVLDPSFEPSIDRLNNYCARYEDLGRFLTCLDDETGSRRPMMTAFMRGYGAETATPLAPAALFAFLTKYGLQALIDRWDGRVIWAQRAGLPGLVRGWMALAETMVHAAA